jgi:hypothetical protein
VTDFQFGGLPAVALGTPKPNAGGSAKAGEFVHVLSGNRG